jgi:exodeoxyribonuclease VII small subunit
MSGKDETHLTYEAAVSELEAIVTALQRDDIGVDELGAKVARGAALVEICRDRLRAAELAVEEVVAALRSEDDPDPGASR